MGQYLFRLPDVGEGVTEAEIIAWHVKTGDHVAEDQSLVDVMTDKATVDMTSPVGGLVVALHGEVGTKAAVGSILVELDVEGAGNAEEATKPQPDAAKARSASKADSVPVALKTEAPSPAPNATRNIAVEIPLAKAPGASPLAAPNIRGRANELGIELQFVPGTGPAGRVTLEDLEAFARMPQGRPVSALRRGVHETRIIGLRRKIAEKMQESKRHIPHFSFVEELDLTELEVLRGDLNAHRDDDKPKLTLLPFFMRALVRVLPEFPNINAHYDEEQGVLRTFEGIHIGIATQTPQGLMVPVVHHAESLDFWTCAREMLRVTSAARDGTAKREELSGSSITLTSLGPLGGIAATPIINRPEVAIIGPNKLVERPVVDGAYLAKRKVMNLSSSFDHRIVDGHDAASFVQRIKRVLEHPALLFLD